MSAIPNAQEADNDFRAFITQYRQHLEDIRAHLSGQISSVGDGEAEDVDGSKDLPETAGDDDVQSADVGGTEKDFVLSASGAEMEDDPWTDTEKDSFFHALSVYSRLRPDLIASHIPTRNVPEVYAYLQALEDAASHHSPSDALERRRAAPLAMAMTDSWIEWEETQSAHLARAEPEWAAHELDERRQEALSSFPSDTSDPARDQLLSRWQAEDVLCALDVYRLRAMARILRAEDANEDHADDLPPPSPHVTNPSERNDDAEDAYRDCSRSSTPSTRELSPKSRRRLQKRLYMRRKRAEKAGTEAIQDAGLLKVGRPAKARPPKKRRRCEHAEDSQEEGDAEEEGQEEEATAGDYAHPHRGGMTAPYKARRLFEESGITPVVLADHKLDLFDGTGLARLLDTIPDQVDSSVDVIPKAVAGDVLAALRAMLVEFVTDVARRAIVTREQELHFKAASKAWRVKKPDEILPKNVEHALQMMGMATLRSTGKRKRSAREDEESEDEEQEEDTDGETDADSREHDGNVAASETDFDIADDLYPTFFRLPQEYLTDPNVLDDILPAEMDEEAMALELAEEDELDAEDSKIEGEYEDQLWLALREHIT
ncbi:hypothetical protein HDZ31DRAFT_59929 [Schizophyllum fasciatum]